MKIYKYPLSLTYKQTVRLPVGAAILDVQIQDGELKLWAIVEPNNTLTPRTIVIIGTGQDLQDLETKYIRSLQVAGFVWHIFEAL